MSTKYPGGLITKNPVTPAGPYQDGAAPGVWTVEQALQYTKQGVWPIAGNVPNYIEDVFSTYLYTGTGASQTITNGIDLSTKGGLVWTKTRSGGAGYDWHVLVDSARGVTKVIETNLTDAEATQTDLTSFTTTGYNLSAGSYYGTFNLSGAKFASWTFRKQSKFFDVVTWTGNDAANRQISHSLGSVPGCIIVKRTDTSATWRVWHQNMVSNPANLYQYQLNLNTTDAVNLTYGEVWGTSNNVTSTTFQVGSLAAVNASGGTYVAYVFAHNAGGFGLTGTDNVISCGSYSGNGTSQSINLGYEPQWVMVKRSDSTGSWIMLDVMRGMDMTDDYYLLANLANAETNYASSVLSPTATGFSLNSATLNNSGGTFIYIAIRRGPMKVPTSGTSVFTTDTGTNGTTNGIVPVGFRPDMSMTAYRSYGGVGVINDRLRGYGTSGGAGQTPVLQTSDISGESGWSSSNAYFYNAWNTTITRGSNGANPGGAGIVTWFFQRAPSVFDEVCYTGTGSTLVLNHNLTVAPELIFIKSRSGSSYWILGGNFGATTYAYKNDWGANDSSVSKSYSGNVGFSAQPTATTVSLDTNTAVNVSGSTYAMWMWATCPGVSKVGTYTGTGALLTVDCGFTTGARFVLITRVGVVGSNNTYVYDSARGITSGNDPYLLLETSSAEVTGTNYVDTTSVGFQVTAAAPAGLNASGGTYIFLAIA